MYGPPMNECCPCDPRVHLIVPSIGFLYVCVYRKSERGEWMRGLGLSFTNPMGTGGVLDVCQCLNCDVWVVYVGSK